MSGKGRIYNYIQTIIIKKTVQNSQKRYYQNAIYS